MTDFELSRRSMIAMTGVALAAAGCTASKESSQTSSPTGGNGTRSKLLADIKSINPPYGDDPNLPPTKAPTGDFLPKVLTLVRIAAGNDFQLQLNYASILKEDDSAFSKVDGEREAIAVEFFEKLSNGGGNPKKKFREIQDGNGFKHHKYQGQHRDKNDFDRFGINQKNEYYFWIDSKYVEAFSLPKQNPQDPDRYYLISFTPILSDETSAKQNFSFYARKVESTLDGLLIAVKNYFRDEAGQDLATNPSVQTLAMNIHFVAKANGRLWIPMVIDPDTGNGMGHEP